MRELSERTDSKGVIDMRNEKNVMQFHHRAFLKGQTLYRTIVQFGLLMSLPMIVENFLGRGFIAAAKDLIVLQLQLAPVFFAFSLGTKAHNFFLMVLHGGDTYRANGHGFVVRHEKFAQNYRMYSRSHFRKGF
ncbi:hypothetical protein POM88_024185 [Heracleum sosnowskyi]|uniref:Glycosyl transferase 48 domain-containing protein n=1 Tax=Heracleum sosnowskyi TaxID=360622 RepID=A0AAD8I2N6_9APIA|nr:hypothetical protein POM88_024185 [Heracleum sosnowskyi]